MDSRTRAVIVPQLCLGGAPSLISKKKSKRSTLPNCPILLCAHNHFQLRPNGKWLGSLGICQCTIMRRTGGLLASFLSSHQQVGAQLLLALFTRALRLPLRYSEYLATETACLWEYTWVCAPPKVCPTQSVPAAPEHHRRGSQS